MSAGVGAAGASVVDAVGLTKRYGALRAVDDASFRIRENTITGLLGRNGAGKTTLMHLITGQELATAGRVEVFGERPLENASVLDRVCFIKESQRYPEDFRVKHALRAAPWFFPQWDAELAEQLVQEFRLPTTRKIKKLSRGQLSAVGVIVGLASRAPLTIFDEPYLGLDAVARQLFYDRLLADVAEHPRTVILSTHLIDEVSSLLEHVVVIEAGRIIVDADAEELRGSATTVVGPRGAVDAFVAGREVLHREGIGGLASVTITALDDAARGEAARAGLELAPVSLQQLVVRMTTHGGAASTDTTTQDEEIAR